MSSRFGSTRFISKNVWSSTRASGTSPLPISEHTLIALDKQIFTFGGKDKDGKPNNKIAVLNTGGLKSWNTDIKETGVPPEPRWGHSAVLLHYNHATHVAIFGGENGAHYFNDVVLFNPDTSRWAKPRTTGKTPLPRVGHSAVALSPEQMLIYGGKYLLKALDDIYLFKIESLSNQWVQVTPKAGSTVPPKRYNHGTVLWNKTVIVFGGTDGKSLFSDIYFLDTEDFEWSKPEISNSISPRTNAAVGLVEDKLFVFGGKGVDGPLNDLYYLDLIELKWYGCDADVLGTLPDPLFGHAMTLLGNSLFYAIGGEGNTTIHIIDFKKIIPVEVTENSDTSATLQRKTTTTTAANAKREEERKKLEEDKKK